MSWEDVYKVKISIILYYGIIIQIHIFKSQYHSIQRNKLFKKIFIITHVMRLLKVTSKYVSSKPYSVMTKAKLEGAANSLLLIPVTVSESLTSFSFKDLFVFSNLGNHTLCITERICKYICVSWRIYTYYCIWKSYKIGPMKFPRPDCFKVPEAAVF